MQLFQPRNYILLTLLPLLTFGVLLIFFTSFVMHLLDLKVNPMGHTMLQFLGASLASHAYLNYQSHKFGKTGLRAVINMNITALSLAVGISLVAVVTHTINHLGYLVLAMHSTFLSGFLYSARKL